MAALHRFERKPQKWLQAILNEATEPAKAAIAKIAS